MPDPRPLLHRAVFEVVGAPIVLRANGVAIAGDQRDELLAAVREGKHVELEMDVMPFRQRPGEQNRNFVRFRDGALHKMGLSGKGTPFLRDHDQGNTLAIGGYVTASQMKEEPVDGEVERRLYQTVKLSAPWAVEMALRGLIRTFSIGWDPEGIMCLACKDDYMNCWHYPGQRLDDEEGGGRVEIEYQHAALVETSVVPVPAVLGTEVEGIRAAMSAARSAGVDSGKKRPQSATNMPRFARLITLLALATPQGADPDENEVYTAVDGLQKKLAKAELDRDAATLRATAAEKDLATAREQLGAREQTEQRSKLDSAIESAYQAKKLVRSTAADGQAEDDPLEAILRRQAELESVDAAVAAIGTLRVRAPFGAQITAPHDPTPRQKLGARGMTAAELASHRAYAEQTGRDPDQYIADILAEQGA